jgi:glycerol uptake facilitator-like aquaporin
MKTVLPLLAEYLGTFLLVLSILSLSNPIFIGIIFTVILFLIIPVSGAAINPALSFVYYLQGKLGMKEALMYTLVQILAAGSSYYLYASLV